MVNQTRNNPSKKYPTITKTLLYAALTFLIIFPQQAECRYGRRSRGDGCLELAIATVALMSFLTNKPKEGEIRRRVSFVEEGRGLTGGVTIKDMTKLHYLEGNWNRFEIFKYNEKRFGSSGQYFMFDFDLSKINGKFNEEVEATVSDFTNYGYKKKGEKLERIGISGEFSKKNLTEHASIEFVNSLIVKSLNTQSENFEITGVNKKPKSWILRIIFYILNFIAIILLCYMASRDSEARGGLSLCYALMENLLLIMLVKMVILYYFVGVFWFMLLILIGYSCATCTNWTKLNFGTSTHAKIYIVIGMIIMLLDFFISTDLLPYAVLYAYFGLTLDLIFGRIQYMASEFLSQFLYQCYMVFSFFNLANAQYYGVDYFHFYLFLIIAAILHVVNLFLYMTKKPKNNSFNEMRGKGGVASYDEGSEMLSGYQ